jgi:hypothetical protein
MENDYEENSGAHTPTGLTGEESFSFASLLCPSLQGRWLFLGHGLFLCYISCLRAYSPSFWCHYLESGLAMQEAI